MGRKDAQDRTFNPPIAGGPGHPAACSAGAPEERAGGPMPADRGEIPAPSWEASWIDLGGEG
jgi:hypothetical protein